MTESVPGSSLLSFSEIKVQSLICKEPFGPVSDKKENQERRLSGDHAAFTATPGHGHEPAGSGLSRHREKKPLNLPPLQSIKSRQRENKPPSPPSKHNVLNKNLLAKDSKDWSQLALHA